MRNPLADDLDHVLARAGGAFDGLRGARIFLTGGTGFFGCWLLESLVWANDHIGLDASVVVLTRDPGAFRIKAPHLAGHPAVTLHQGEARTFALPGGPFSHVVHAAVDARPPRTQEDRLRVFDTIVDGTRRALEFARRSGAKRFLLTSSGGIYGPQPADVTHLPEAYAGALDPADARRAGAEAKRAAEMLCAVHADGGLEPTIARCFTFVGAYLPLDAHFALGNFVRDALRGGPIRVTGDGAPQRSYMYAADLVVWLWTILVRGEPMRPYNVGSAEAVTIGDVAQLIGNTFTPPLPVLIARAPAPGAAVERYVPAVMRAETELDLRVTVPTADGVRRMVEWHLETGRV